MRCADDRIPVARAELRRLHGALDAYQAVVIPAGATGSVTGSSGISAYGLSAIDLSLVDTADNPIEGEFGRGGVTRADYRWMVETWASVVGPGVESGMNRDDFEALDARRQARPLRRTVDVFDIFTTDPIAIDHMPSGDHVIRRGRHRIEVAKELRLTSLPGRIDRP